MFVDKFGQVRGKSNNAVGSPAGLENGSPGAGPIAPPPLEATYRGSAKSVTSINLSGIVATAVITGHGFSVGDIVRVAGADQLQYNGDKRVDSSADANTITYTVYGSPTSPATGTITATKRLIEAYEDNI